MEKMRIARMDEIQAVHDFYNAVIDHLSGARYTPGWEANVYPDRNLLLEKIGRSEIHIIEKNGKIVCAEALNLNAQGDALEIHLLAVHPDFTGMGYGKAMVRFAIESAARMGAKQLCLDVSNGNLPAERLYTGMGFVYAGNRREWFDENDFMDFRQFTYSLNEKAD